MVKLVETSGADPLAELAANIRACRICRDQPLGKRLPHEPRPVLQESTLAPILIAGQAPGTRVHASGRPFTDPSGVRLRQWLGVTEAEFYDPANIAVAPMGFCFPGLSPKGADLPPRRECAPAWRADLMAAMPQVRLIILLGQYAQRWHMGKLCGPNLTATVQNWRAALALEPMVIPLPHPSWRNNGWLKANPWLEQDVVPVLRAEVRRLLERR